MESRVYLLFVIYFVTCILHKNALGGSTSSKIITSFNNASQSDVPLRTMESIEMVTRLNEMTLKDDKPKPDISLESSKNLSERIESEKNFLKSSCSRYCIQQMETDKNNSIFEDINLFLSFMLACTGNENKEDKNFNREILHDFLLGNNRNMKIIKHISINNKNSTNLNICEKKKIDAQRVNYTEISSDANVTQIVISIFKNFSQTVLTTYIKINAENNFNEILDEDTQSKATNINTKEFNNLKENAAENIVNNRTNIYAISVINSKINKRSKFAHVERSAEIINEKIINNEDEMTEDFSDVLLPSVKSTIAKNIANYSIFSLRNNLTSYGGNIKIPQNVPKDTKTNGKIFTVEQQQKIQSRSSEIASLNEDIDTNDMKISTLRNNVLMEIQDSNQDFSTEFTRNIGDSLERRKIFLEINAKSNLIATPGTTHRVFFDVTNSCVLPVRYAIRARSSPFRILSTQPIYLWLYPQQTNYVAVDVGVPLGTQDSVNTLTLLIEGTDIPEKTVYIYVQNAISKNIDDVKPTLEYSFNSNCAGKLDKDRCEKTFWSADIIVQDSNSGLKSVISTPNGLYSRTKFVSGTKDRITFYYLSSCCSTTATITAIDVSDNQYSRTIDVTAWDNLSQGEIAAIVLGALLLLFLIIFLIIAIIYCISRRNSHDLPYTQRYGSRPPARSERTSF